MIHVLLIAIGGAIGAILRHVTYRVSLRVFNRSDVFTGTLAANIAGCLIAGILLAFFSQSETDTNNIQLFLMVGLLGSYTTFSTFAFEALHLLKDNGKDFALYLFCQVAAAFTAFSFGFGFTLWAMGGAV